MSPSRHGALAAALAASALLASGCGLSLAGTHGAATPAVPKDTPYATVDGRTISRAQVVQEARLETLGTPDGLTPQVLDQALNNLIDQELVLKAHPTQASPTLVADLTQAETSYLESVYHGKAGLEKYLRDEGLSSKDLTLFLTDYVRVKTALGEAVGSQVTRAAEAAYVKAHPSQFQVAEVRHILVRSRSLAESLVNRLRHGASFAALARRYSIDPGSNTKGGIYRNVTPGEMVAPFNAATFTWPVGKIGIVHSQYGWHVLQVMNRHPMAQAQALQAAYTPVLGQAIQQYLSRLRQAAHVVVHGLAKGE